jgi:D-glycero-alpha-D-manno-heptose-7-phosphate kinase
MRILSKAPTRIDLSGGTLDIWPLYLFVEEAVTVNAAISLYATATIETQEDLSITIRSIDQKATESAPNLGSLPTTGKLSLISRFIRHFAPSQGFTMITDCAAPAGSGLGGSSALAIAVCGALNELTGQNHSAVDLLGIARDIEAQQLQIPTGEQDYFAAVYGGFQGWHFKVREVLREPYDISTEDIQNRLVLFFSGKSRASGINNWQVFRSFVDGDPVVRRTLTAIRSVAFEVHHSFKQGNWDRASDNIQREWVARKELAPDITTPEVEELIRFGLANGALTGRVCGAGGGGAVVLLVDPTRKKRLVEKAIQNRFHLLDFEVVDRGLQVQRIE